MRHRATTGAFPARAVDRRPQHVGVTWGTILLGERVTMLSIDIGDHVSGNGRCS